MTSVCWGAFKKYKGISKKVASRRLSDFSEEKKAKIIDLYLNGGWSITTLIYIHGKPARDLLLEKGLIKRRGSILKRSVIDNS